LHAHDLLAHWDRYAKTTRIVREVNDLLTASLKLLEGYHKLQEDDERFLGNLELPDNLKTDFVLGRNLFSIGLDELGVFAAGRGLEGVLRDIASRRKLTYRVKGKDEPLDTATFHDLAEAFSRIKLTNGTPLIDKQTRSLLELARNARNSAAHPGTQSHRTERQLAEIIANAAQHVWTACKGTRLTKAPIIRDW
jgi:hypothetical protein